MSTRRNQVAELVKRSIATIISQDLKGKAPAMISVTRVEMSPDLKHAKIFVSIFGNAKGSAKTYLERQRSYIRKLLGKSVSLRYTPQIMFIIDNAIEYGVHIGDIINKIKEEEHWDEEREDTEDAPLSDVRREDLLKDKDSHEGSNE